MRKLLLAGLSVVMARGTMAQVYFVAAVESFFLCYHFRTYPCPFICASQLSSDDEAPLRLTANGRSVCGVLLH